MAYPEHLHNHVHQVAEKIGLDASDMTIVKMSPGSDERHKELELVQGQWEDMQPWIMIDEDDQVFTLTSVDSLSAMVRMLVSAQNENFQHKLEKAIWQRIPIDFDDVWAVAMDRIRSLAKSRSDSTVVDLDLDWLVREIQEKHPNLFYHIDQAIQKKREE